MVIDFHSRDPHQNWLERLSDIDLVGDAVLNRHLPTPCLAHRLFPGVVANIDSLQAGRVTGEC